MIQESASRGELGPDKDVATGDQDRFLWHCGQK
jgi:hypothetical protein